MLGRIWLAYGIVARTFGKRFAPIPVFVALLVLRGTLAVLMTFDAVLFPSLRRQRVVSPILIVGNPRTGTTFLQRFLAEHGVGRSLELWRMVYPSLILQKLMTGLRLLPLLERVSPAKYHSTDAHETSLTSVETDDVSLLFRFFDGFFLYGFLLAWDDADHRPAIEARALAGVEREADWLEAIWRRNLVATGGTRVLAKHFSLTPRLPAFLARFPDARVLYMVRDPLETIPSGMSLVTGVLDRAFGIWDLPEATRRRYLDRLYAALVELFLRFHDDWASGRIDKERVLVVTYDRLMADFETVMDEILAFTGTEAGPELRAAIAVQGDQQRGHRSKHSYNLEQFGLSAERIRQDCACVYETFGVGGGT